MNRVETYKLLIKTLELNDNDVDEDTSLDSINFDSMVRIILISVIDETFNKIVSAESLFECKTIGDIVDLIIKE